MPQTIAEQTFNSVADVMVLLSFYMDSGDELIEASIEKDGATFLGKFTLKDADE